jgi:LEA14-like dessication related protein
MRHQIPFLIFVVLTVFLLICGCTTEPPIKEPVVTVQDISLSDVSLQKLTVNTTVNIFNPNPVGGNLDKVQFDVYYLDGTPRFLGHGEKYDINVKENGNTSVTIPVTIGNLQALNAIGTLSQKGSITLLVNGSAFLDVKVTSWEVPFHQTREFAASEFDAYLPLSAIASINVSEKINKVTGFLSTLS